MKSVGQMQEERGNKRDPQHKLILSDQSKALPSQNQQSFGSEDAACPDPNLTHMDVSRSAFISGYGSKPELDFIWVVLFCSDRAVSSVPCSSIPCSCPWDAEKTPFKGQGKGQQGTVGRQLQGRGLLGQCQGTQHGAASVND